jgi:CBS domain-containing protein
VRAGELLQHVDRVRRQREVHLLTLVCVLADGIGQLLMRNSIMTENLARRGLRVHQDYEVDVLRQVAVREVMDPRAPVAPQSMRMADLSGRIANHDEAFTWHHALFLVDEERRLTGIVTRGDLVRALDLDPAGQRTAIEAGSDMPIVCYPDEPLHAAVTRMLANDIGRLPVVSRDDAGLIVGYLGRAAILEARARRLREEHVADAGWLWTARSPERPA